MLNRHHAFIFKAPMNTSFKSAGLKSAGRSSWLFAWPFAALLAAALIQPAVAADTPAASPDRTFLTKAGGGGLYEVEMSRIAAMRTKNPELKAFAEMLVNDHSAANAELRQLADSKGVVIATEVPPEKKAVIARLEQSKDFDRDFIRQVGLADHKANIAMFQKTSKEARDPDVRTFAAKTLPRLKEHLAQAERLSRSKPMTHDIAHAAPVK